ncbi:MAG TPA: hypothetical protein DDZ70_06210, partial [Firmicutes bacterium]|nr:hypothetical protein [Bacillota bacterium]
SASQIQGDIRFIFCYKKPLIVKDSFSFDTLTHSHGKTHLLSILAQFIPVNKTNNGTGAHLAS